MTPSEYALKMERRLIAEFKESFYNKMGYFPVVLSKYQLADDQVGYMSLEKLTNYFTPFLPERHGMPIALSSKSRYREIVELRFIYSYLGKSMKYSLATIGKALGGRDHTTVIHNLTQFANMMETCEKFRIKYKMVFDYVREQEQKETDGTSIMEYLQKLQDKSEPIVLSGLLPVQDNSRTLDQRESRADHLSSEGLTHSRR